MIYHVKQKSVLYEQETKHSEIVKKKKINS